MLESTTWILGHHTFEPHIRSLQCHPGASFRPRPMCRRTRHHASHRCFGKLSDVITWGKHFRWGWVYDFTLHFGVEFILSWLMSWGWRFTQLSWVLIWGSLHFTNVDLQVAMTTEPSTLKVWIAGMFDRWFREKWGVCWSALEAKFAAAVPMKCQMLSWKLWQFWCCCTFGKKPFMILRYIRELPSLKLSKNY